MFPDIGNNAEEGSYMGGAANYLLGFNDAFGPTGIFMGIAGGVLALITYNKLKS